MPYVPPLFRERLRLTCPVCGRERDVPRMHSDPLMTAQVVSACVGCDPKRKGETVYVRADGRRYEGKP